ncbi:MAG: hypothetical protein V4659_04090 [Pseudomonadota bacterium]
MTRQHRNEIAYPRLWRALDGAIRDASACHPDILIPDRRRASIVKRAVGSVLALVAGAGDEPAAKAAVQLPGPAVGVQLDSVEGAITSSRPQRRRGRTAKSRAMFPWHSLDLSGRRALHAFIAGQRSRFVAFHRGRDGLVFVEMRR